MARIDLDVLYAAATTAMKNAYQPYSEYSVGVALITTDGNIYSGCNVENVSYGMTLCAEVNAIGTMVAAGGRQQVDHVVLVASGNSFPSPCGACRQMVAEFSTPETMFHFAKSKDKSDEYAVRSYRMSTLLPLSYTQSILWDRDEKKQDPVRQTPSMEATEAFIRDANNEENTDFL